MKLNLLGAALALGALVPMSCGLSATVSAPSGSEAGQSLSAVSVADDDGKTGLEVTVEKLKAHFSDAGYNVDFDRPDSVDDWLQSCPNAVTATVVSASRGENTISDLTTLTPEVRNPEAGERISGWIELGLDVTASENELPRTRTVLLPYGTAGVFVDDTTSLEVATEHARDQLDQAWQGFADLDFDGLRLALCVSDEALAMERVYDGVPLMDAVSTGDDAPVVALSGNLSETFSHVSFADLEAAIRG